MPTESTFLLAGLFLLLAAAGWAMGRFGERDEEQAPPPLNIDYLKGLNFLLNEQTDQALEHFLQMVRVDDKTIETHFALGSLFRRRGEVDRAIRIHQNIIARPDLAAEQRDQALYSLAKDYLHAGLLDRAENLFARLSQGSRYQVQALEALCRIYAQEKEWERAIDAAERLEVLGGRSLALQIAHYYCELAEASAQQNDYAAARAYVKKAQKGRPRTMRGALTRAHIAQETHDSKTALRLYHRIIDSSPTIRDCRWWRIGMASALERLEHFSAGFCFRLGNTTGCAQAAVYVNHGRAPELTGFVGFGVVLFSPLLCT